MIPDLLKSVFTWLWAHPLLGGLVVFTISGLAIAQDFSGFFLFCIVLFVCRVVDRLMFSGRLWSGYKMWAQRRRNTSTFRAAWPGLAHDLGLTRKSIDGVERVPKLTEVNFDD